MKTQFCRLILALVLIQGLYSCGETEEVSNDPIVLKGYIEQGLLPLMDTLFKHYEAKDMNVTLDLTADDTFEGFRQLLSGRTPMLISSRTYTPREDSLMVAHSVEPFKRIALAHDALVVIAQKNSPLDTLNHLELVNYMSNPKYSLTSDYGFLEEDPRIVVPDTKSSVYSAISRHIFRYKPITIEERVTTMTGSENITDLVANGEYQLGLAFLSQVAMDTSRVKLIKIGYNSNDIIGEDNVKKANKDLGKGQIRPKPVHASYVIMRQYPYIVTHWIYLQQDIKDNYFFFARYLGEDRFTQTFFTEQGIQGEHVKYKLQPQ